MGQILQTPGHRLVHSHERRADVPGFGIGERRIRVLDKPAPERPHLLAIVFDRVARLVPVRVGNYGDQTVRPVQVVGGDLGRGVAKIRRSVVHVRIKGATAVNGPEPKAIHITAAAEAGTSCRSSIATM